MELLIFWSNYSKKESKWIKYSITSPPPPNLGGPPIGLGPLILTRNCSKRSKVSTRAWLNSRWSGRTDDLSSLGQKGKHLCWLLSEHCQPRPIFIIVTTICEINWPRVVLPFADGLRHTSGFRTVREKKSNKLCLPLGCLSFIGVLLQVLKNEVSPFILRLITMEQFTNLWTAITLLGMLVHQSGITTLSELRLQMHTIQSIRVGINQRHGERPLGK